MGSKCEGCGKFKKNLVAVPSPLGQMGTPSYKCADCVNPKPWPNCSESSCRRPARRRSETPYCNMHYERIRKHGTTELIVKVGRSWIDDKGYRVLQRPNHPLAQECGKVYEHRLVLYAVLGPGKHACHWCKKPVEWGADLEVDHLDGNKMNNTPENLAPCCHACNTWYTKLRNTEGMTQ